MMDAANNALSHCGRCSYLETVNVSNCKCIVQHIITDEKSDEVLFAAEGYTDECESDVGSDPFVDDYSHTDCGVVYTAQNIPGMGCNLEEFNTQFTEGCDCSDGSCSLEAQCSCLQKFGKCYDNTGLLLKSKFGGAVMECNSQCLCFGKSKCGNRVVQLGPASGLEIYDTKDGRGMALRSTVTLYEGSFICEYAGEVIGLQEASRRFGLQSKNSMNYIFVLNEHLGDGNILKTCIDPTSIGNIGRYINHSCEPNSAVVPVRVDTVIPKLGIFASRAILAGEEITFNYGIDENAGKEIDGSRKLCLCGAQNCKKFLPFDNTLL